MERLTARLLASIAAFVTSAAVAAPNLVNNGGFETGDFSGWSPFGNTSFSGVQCPGPGATVAEGNCSAFFGPVGSAGGISQSINLQTGVQYWVSFSFLPDGLQPSSFSASFGGNTLVSLVNPAASSSFENFTFLTTATSSSEALSFSFRDDLGFMFLDKVSVSRVPEPPMLALMVASFGAALFASKRRATRT